MNFLEARAKLKELSKGEYRSMSYEITESLADNHIEISCRVYVNPGISCTAPTWEEALYDIACQLYPYGVFMNTEIEDIVVEEK